MKAAIIIATVFYLGICIAAPQAFAISEYGIRCDDNKKCVSCRDNISCIKCIHRCENAYGLADGSSKRLANESDDALCNRIRAKWCNAQCWDPDDYKDPEYISTKPNCSARSFLPKEE